MATGAGVAAAEPELETLEATPCDGLELVAAGVAIAAALTGVGLGGSRPTER